jgi:predicted ATPase/class 3 adenylate cyclase
VQPAFGKHDVPAPRPSAIRPEQFATFGQLLRFLRQRAGLTQREISIAVGYSESQISRLEQSHRAPDDAVLAARFVPALLLDHEPGWAARLLELGAVSRGEGPADEPEPPEPVALGLPTGTVTFLFTDVEGSTQLWQRHRDAMPAALARHHAILTDAIAAHGRHVFQIVGDAFCAAFATPAEAVGAALAAQRGLRDEAWGATGPIRVRMALHSGSTPVQPGDHVSGEYRSGITLSRAARLLSAANGGQMLLSQVAYDLLLEQLPDGLSLRDLGQHQLKDLVQPEHIYQLVAPDLAAEFPPLVAGVAPRHNLPIQLTSFIGRERDIAAVKRLLATTRLLTLTGVGGTGKTRLALQVAGEVVEQYADGVWLVELAALADPALVPRAVGATFDLRDQPGRTPIETLVDYLRPRALLLILDNCEHLIEACARLADTVLHACPHVQLLATSREGLGIAGEVTWSVPSLSVPDVGQVLDQETASASEAVRLFVQRAQAVKPELGLTDQNAQAVARLCQRLDGIPLAIELAAARVKVLTIEQIATRLDDRFRLLTGGSRTALERQQTLRATLDWSYQLLSEPERVLLQRLSVFSGGWTLEAAEQVCSGDGLEAAEVLEVLARLVGKSLALMAAEDGDAPRYRLLETIRQYARERMLLSSTGENLRDRHLAFYLRLAEELEPKLKTAERLVLMKQLRTELDNFRGGLEWSLAERDPARAGQGLRLASALRRFWQYCGYLAEGRAWLEKGLTALGSAHSGLTEIRANALHTAGLLALYQEDTSNAQATLLEESIALYRQAARADPRNLSDALNGLADTKLHWDPALARSLIAESITICRALGPAGTWELAEALFIDGEFAIFLGDDTTARARAEESCALFRHSGDVWSVAKPNRTLGHIAARQGDYAVARSFFSESLRLCRASAVGGTARVLEWLGDIDRILGDYETASVRYEESLRLWRDMGNKYKIARSLRTLAIAALYQGDYERARVLLVENVAPLRESILTADAAGYSPDASDHYAVALTLAGLSGVARARGQWIRAARLLGGAESLVMSMADAKNEVISLGTIADQIEYERLVSEERSQLPESTLAAASAEGQSMTWEQALELALQFGQKRN